MANKYKFIVLIILLFSFYLPIPTSAQNPCPQSVATESQWFNASKNGKPLTGPALAQFKRILQSQGWKSFSGVMLRGGAWMIKASRTVIISECIITPLLPGVYYDDIGKCFRLYVNGLPAPGQRCTEPS